MKNFLMVVLGVLALGLAACRSTESGTQPLPEIRYYEIADT